MNKKNPIKKNSKKKKARKMLITDISRQKKALKCISENKGNVYKGLIQAGYSDNYARSGQIKKTKSWQQLVDEYLGDNLVAEMHHSTLTAKKLLQMNFDETTSDEEIREIMNQSGFKVMRIYEARVEYTNAQGELKSFKTKKCIYSVPDTMSRNKAIDLAYKLKDKYPKEKLDLTVTRPFKDLSDEELSEVIDEGIKFLRKK